MKKIKLNKRKKISIKHHIKYKLIKTSSFPLDKKPVIDEFTRLSRLFDIGDFESAYCGALLFLEKLNSDNIKNSIYYVKLYNIAGLLIDIGSEDNKKYKESLDKGIQLMEENEESLKLYIKNEEFYFNLANGKLGAIKEKNPLDQTFETIEQLIDVKNYYWKAIRISYEKSGVSIPEHNVNLANTLKKQFRISEALKYYDEINSESLDIPQAWINRSESLKLLKEIAHSYSINMFEQIINGYKNAIESRNMPHHLKERYNMLYQSYSKDFTAQSIKNDPHENVHTNNEYQSLSVYRKFCLDNYLTLSEHALYCNCIGSAKDDLTITSLETYSADFVRPMERSLNRIKSEFAFARYLYYKYLHRKLDDEFQNDLYFYHLPERESLGIGVEKLRTAFRLCFGILDKIANAICKLYDASPPSGTVSFQSFWQLDKDGRRQKFESFKNPGLLALYSIATDLNDKKNGEWANYKELRNNLEHDFVIVHNNDTSHTCDKKDVILIKESDFVNNLERLFQLTRSAVFSFVFTVRDKIIKEEK